MLHPDSLRYSPLWDGVVTRRVPHSVPPLRLALHGLWIFHTSATLQNRIASEAS